MFEVWVPIKAVFNGCECRISQQITGPRSGKSWKRLTYNLHATGGLLQMWLDPGYYKRNTWVSNNPVPSVEHFTIDESGNFAWEIY